MSEMIRTKEAWGGAGETEQISGRTKRPGKGTPKSAPHLTPAGKEWGARVCVGGMPAPAEALLSVLGKKAAAPRSRIKPEHWGRCWGTAD